MAMVLPYLPLGRRSSRFYGEGVVVKKEYVLLVEDDPNDVMIVKAAFVKLGRFELSVAEGGKGAVAYLSGVSPYNDRSAFPLPKAVLLDLKMPEMDGFQVLKWVRKRPEFQRLPIIVLTTSTYSSDLRRAYAEGASSFIGKASSIPEMAEELKAALDFWVPDRDRQTGDRASGEEAMAA
jgi:CheY-like chemotaxis protein